VDLGAAGERRVRVAGLVGVGRCGVVCRGRPRLRDCLAQTQSWFGRDGGSRSAEPELSE
jgi:hypothetical protein